LIDGALLEEESEYKYLGRILTPGNEMIREVDERITADCKTFGHYSTFFKRPKDAFAFAQKYGKTNSQYNLGRQNLKRNNKIKDKSKRYHS
jgi:hypothetical protein